VHYRSALSHEQGTVNAQTVAKALKTELIIITDKDNIHQRCFTNNVQAYFRKPSPAMASMMCVACKIKWGDIYRIAKENGIRLIAAASNPYENTEFKRGFHGFRPGEPAGYAKRLVRGVREIAKNPRYVNRHTFKATLGAFVYLDSRSPIMKALYPGMKKVDIFYYHDWDEKQVLDTITALGWKKPDAEKSTWRFDCLAGKVKDYIYLSGWGFTEKDDLYSQLIRAGKLTREDAMERIVAENVPDEEGVRHCFSVCGLDPDKALGSRKPAVSS
jgi:hypothetical protein